MSSLLDMECVGKRLQYGGWWCPLGVMYRINCPFDCFADQWHTCIVPWNVISCPCHTIGRINHSTCRHIGSFLVIVPSCYLRPVLQFLILATKHACHWGFRSSQWPHSKIKSGAQQIYLALVLVNPSFNVQYQGVQKSQEGF